MTKPRAAGPLVAALAGLLAAACAAGPDFKSPAPPKVSGYTDHPLAAAEATPGVPGGEAQRFVSGADPAGDWWTMFHSPALNALVQQALANNHDLKAAQAALTAARETTRAQRGAYYPQVSAGFAGSAQRQSETIAPTPSNNAFEYNLFTPQVSVAYTLDAFGLTRRTVENARAQEDAVRYQMLAAHLTLTSNVAAAAIQDASLKAQIDATRQLIDIGAKVVETLKYQQDKGYASGLDLAAQQGQLAQLAATLPPLLKASAQQHDLIAVLVGRFPGQAPPEKFDLASLTLPADLPVSLPSRLVAQRPDVLQAEANLHAATAQVGIATANRLPNIQITANAGSTALTLGEVFGPHTSFWAIAAGLTAPIFQGGTLLHQERAAKATLAQSAEQYQSTVLTAFQNVADSLNAVEQDAATLKAAKASSDAAQVTLDLSQRQYKAGYANYLALERRAGLPAGAHRLGAGRGRPVRRHRCALPVARRRLVAPRRLGQGSRCKLDLSPPCSRPRRSRVLAGCSPKADSTAQAATTTPQVLTLSAAQLQHVTLFTVQPASYRKTIEAAAVVDFDNDQATSVLAPISGPVARLLVEPGQKVAAEASRWPWWPLPTSPRPWAPTPRRWPPRARTASSPTPTRTSPSDNGVSQREAEQAQTDAANAEADSDAALQALVALNVDPKAIKDIQAGRPPTRAEGAIRAPMAGTVVERLITPGQLLQAGTTPAFTVANLSKVWVMAQVSSSELASVSVGDPAQVEAGAGQPDLSGTVDNVAALVNPDTRAVVARIVVANPAGLLKKQMYVRVRIQSRQASTGLLVPVSAILRDDENLPFVYVAQAGGGFARRHVTLGYRAGDQYDIPAGLKAGDRVVTDGGVFVQFMQSQ